MTLLSPSVPLLAEVSNTEFWMCASTVGLFVVNLVTSFRKQDVKVDQPLSVKMAELLVTKDEFHRHQDHNENVHKEIFAKIGGVDRGANVNLDRKVAEIRQEQVAQGKLIAGLQASTEMQNQQLTAIQSSLQQMLQKRYES